VGRDGVDPIGWLCARLCPIKRLRRRPGIGSGLVDGPPTSPFGKPWDSLRLADVRRFFSHEVVERAIWEGKGSSSKAELSAFVRKECCGFANHRGGYLVLGVDEIGRRRWKITGIDLPTVREIHDWVANLLRDLDPVPTFDTQEWGLPNGRRLAVVQVNPQAIPPVAWKGKVFKRSGSQTVRLATGTEIGLLARRGEKVRRATERRAGKAAAEVAKTIFAPFGLAIANAQGGRTQLIADREPEKELYKNLKRELQVRWPKRRLTPLVFEERAGWDELEEIPLLENSGGAEFAGWRASWQVQNDRKIALKNSRRRKLGAAQPKRDRSVTDRDIWITILTPDGVGKGLYWPLPVRETRIDLEFGKRAISRAALLLRVLLRAEAELGADQHEQVAVSFVLNSWGTGVAPIALSSWVTVGGDPRAWKRQVQVEAERQTVLLPAP
jgi:hypothetical protein